MRRGYSLIIMFMLLCMYGVVGEPLSFASAELSKDVEFTYDRVCNIGFSRERITSTIEPDPSVNLSNIEFVVDTDTFDRYTTDQFYLYAQVFSVNPVRIYVSASEPLSNGLAYTNVDSWSKSLFTGSGGTLEDENGASYTEPRVYNIPLEFTIPTGAVNPAQQYTGVFSVTLEVK